MSDNPEAAGRVIQFRRPDKPRRGPSLHCKPLAEDDKRATCRHGAVWIWPREPILECRNCGAVVDPHEWIRNRCRDWDDVLAEFEWRKEEARRELDAVKAELRKLRREYQDERERREAERAIAMLPPPRRTRP